MEKSLKGLNLDRLSL